MVEIVIFLGYIIAILNRHIVKDSGRLIQKIQHAIPCQVHITHPSIRLDKYN